jgi:hypothetical protein
MTANGMMRVAPLNARLVIEVVTLIAQGCASVSRALPPRFDVVARIEADRLAIGARDRDDRRILVLERLKERLGRAPQAVV